MTPLSEEQRFPSLEEFQGWYNLGYERPGGIPVLNSQEGVPEFEHGEFFHLYVAENPWFQKLVQQSQLKPFDPIADPPMFVHSSADDRTLEVYPDFDYVTEDLIRRIQREFLGRHPFWRVVLVAYAPSCSIVIYPEVVRFGGLPLGVNPSDALRELLPRAITAQEAMLRPTRAQVEFLRQRLPHALDMIRNQPFVVVGVLQSKTEDDVRLFLMLRGADDDCLEVHDPTDAFAGVLPSSGRFGIDENGTIISYISIPDSATFCIKIWHPPVDYRGPLTITNRKTGESYVYQLKSEDIT
ncbi:MAG TPA: hypothetical protein VGN12_22245 [Pirellulales bacterium]|jgi:hypothetical protein